MPRLKCSKWYFLGKQNLPRMWVFTKQAPLCIKCRVGVSSYLYKDCHTQAFVSTRQFWHPEKSHKAIKSKIKADPIKDVETQKRRTFCDVRSLCRIISCFDKFWHFWDYYESFWGQKWPKSGHKWPKSGLKWPKSGQMRPNAATNQQKKRQKVAMNQSKCG